MDLLMQSLAAGRQIVSDTRLADRQLRRIDEIQIGTQTDADLAAIGKPNMTGATRAEHFDEALGWQRSGMTISRPVGQQERRGARVA